MRKKPWIIPRNPLVAPSLFRKAGKHGTTTKAQRRLDQVELQRTGAGKGVGKDDGAVSTMSWYQDVVETAWASGRGNPRLPSGRGDDREQRCAHLTRLTIGPLLGPSLRRFTDARA